MTKFNMVERHRKRHCNNDKGDDRKIEIEMKRFREVEKQKKENDTSGYLLMKILQ